MRDMTEIARVVRQTLAADFGSVEIIDVLVHDELDIDGDAVLRVEVIFEGMPKEEDARALSSVVRHVRPKLNAIGEKAFPLFSFISRDDWGGGRLKSA